MKKATCSICFSENRPVKYSTPDISICQWCVTKLKDKPINPDLIISQLREVAARNIEKPPKEPDEDKIKQIAEEEVASKSSSLQNIVNFFFTSQKRKYETEKIYSKLQMEANARYQEELSKYDREALINELLEQMVSENRIPQVVQDVYVGSNFYGPHYARRLGVLKDDITPLHRDYLKYIRAYLILIA